MTVIDCIVLIAEYWCPKGLIFPSDTDTRFAGLAELDNKYGDVGDSEDYKWFFESTADANPAPPSNSSRRRRRRQAYDYDYYSEDDFYPDWGGITDDSDWEAFYNSSKTSDFTDLQSIVKPTREELLEYGHEAKTSFCSVHTTPTHVATSMDENVHEN